MKFLASFLLIAAFVFSAESISYPHHLTLKENVFDVHWNVNTTEDRFYFKVVATTTGWVGFAMTTNEGGEDMKNYDIALGGVRNNASYLKDYWSASETMPTLDTTQNLVLTSAMESNGKTTIEFNRMADTGDAAQDTSLKNNTIFIAWAIGKEDATSNTSFAKHADKAGGGRGHTNMGYNMYTAKPITTPTSAPTTKQAGSVIVPSIVALVLIQLGMQLIN